MRSSSLRKQTLSGLLVSLLLLAGILTTGCRLLKKETKPEMNRVVYSEKIEGDILIGSCNREGLSSGEFGEWFLREYNTYAADSLVITSLRKADVSELSICIVLGTWCSDSRREVPRFYRVLDDMEMNEDKLELRCVNRAKEVPGMDISRLDITHVPTFIIYRSGKEYGRIIETPEENLEKDLLDIISGIM